MKNITILQNISTLDQKFMIHIPTTKNLFSGLRYYNHNEKAARKFTNMDMGFIMNLQELEHWYMRLPQKWHLVSLREIK